MSAVGGASCPKTWTKESTQHDIISPRRNKLNKGLMEYRSSPLEVDACEKRSEQSAKKLVHAARAPEPRTAEQSGTAPDAEAGTRVAA